MLTDKFLRLQSALFRLLGLELLHEQDVGHRYPWRSICCILSVASFMPLTIAFGLQNVQNVEQLTDSLCSVLVDLLALCKIGLFLWLYKDFKFLIGQFYCVLQTGKLSIIEMHCINSISYYNRNPHRCRWNDSDQGKSSGSVHQCYVCLLFHYGWPFGLPDVPSIHAD